MKIKNQITIRTILLISDILLNILSKQNIDSKIVKEFLSSLNDIGINELDIENFSSTISNIRVIDLATSFYTQTKTDEYKEIKKNYNEVLKNVATLTNELDLSDPIEIFSLYVYMYTNGYLSNNKCFVYNSNMKDFARMQGIDVIRGSGVCRSISSMLTDIYNEIGYNSSNLSVYADKKSIKNLQKLYDKFEGNEQLKVSNNGKMLVLFVTLLTRLIPLSNHQITTVEKDNINYILDPTNDGFLQKGKHKKLLVPNSNNYMSFKSSSYMLLNIIKNNGDTINIFKLYKQLSLPTITDNEYRKIYLETLKLCKENIDMFEKFYKENNDFYNEICNISNKQRGLLGRVYPILPNPEEIKKYLNKS